MSRSYKKTPIIKYGGLYGTRSCKKLFNKRVRAIKIEDELPNNAYYRKLSEQWDLYDIVSYCSASDFMENRRWNDWKSYRNGILYIDFDNMPDPQVWRQCYLIK